MKYDSTKDTTKKDVQDAIVVSETQVKEAVAAVKDLVTGKGSSEATKKEVKEAVEAVENVVLAEVDLAVDGVKRFFKTVFGHRLHDPSQGVSIEPHEATSAEHTEWVGVQIAAGLVVETDKDGNVISAPVAPPSKAAGENIDTDRQADADKAKAEADKAAADAAGKA